MVSWVKRLPDRPGSRTVTHNLGKNMLIKKSSDIPSSEITSKSVYLNRRRFLTGAAIAGAASVAGFTFHRLSSPTMVSEANTKIEGIQKSAFSTTETQTPYKDVTNYNNFYE